MRNRYMIAGLGAALFALVWAPLGAAAFEIRAGEQSTIAASEQVSDDAYLFGATVTSRGAIDGDLIGAGQRVHVDGAVSGDVMLAGETVSILSTVGDDVRAAGSDVLLTGAVFGDVLVFGKTLQISGERVGGDILAAGERIDISAAVDGAMRIWGSHVTINGAVAGDIEVHAETLTLGPNASIAGAISYTGATPLVREPGAAVLGEVTYTERAARGDAGAGIAGVFTFGLLTQFMTLFVMALLFGLLLRRFARELVTRALARPLSHTGLGVITVILLPIISTVLLLTLFFLPLGVLGWLGLIGLLILSWIFAPILLGVLLHRFIRKTQATYVSWKTILLGAAVFTLLGIIPIIGWIVVLFLILLSAGAIVKMKWDLLKNWR